MVSRPVNILTPSYAYMADGRAAQKCNFIVFAWQDDDNTTAMSGYT